MPTKYLVVYLFSFVYVFEVQRLRLQFIYSLTSNVRSIDKTRKTIICWATLFTTIDEKKFKKRNKIFILARCIVNIFVRRFSIISELKLPCLDGKLNFLGRNNADFVDNYKCKFRIES